MRVCVSFSFSLSRVYIRPCSPLLTKKAQPPPCVFQLTTVIMTISMCGRSPRHAPQGVFINLKVHSSDFSFGLIRIKVV